MPHPSPLYAERRLIRKKSVTFVQEFRDKCRNLADTQLPDTPLHKAANYALNQKEAVEKFLHDPRLDAIAKSQESSFDVL